MSDLLPEVRSGEVYEFVAYVNPVAWKAPTLGTKRLGNKVFPTAAPNMEVEAYKRALREQFEQQWAGYGRAPIRVPVQARWYFTRQLSSYRSASGRAVTKHRQDLTNLQKSSEDALQPWLIHNDVLVTKAYAEIVRQEKDVEDPQVHLTIQIL